MRKFKLFSYLLIAGVTLNFDSSVMGKVSGVLFHNVFKFTPLVQHVNWQSYRHFASSSSAEEVGERSGLGKFPEVIKVADPTYDPCFKPLMKYLFGGDKDTEPKIKKYGIDMLNDLLHDDLKELGLKIVSVEIDTDTVTKVVPSSNVARTINKVIFDVRLKCGCQKYDPQKWEEDASSDSVENGSLCATSIIVEMQRKRENFFIDRSYSYEAFNKVAHSRHTITSKKGGDDNEKGTKVRYGDIAATFVVSFLNHNVADEVFKNCGAAFCIENVTKTLFSEEGTTSKVITARGAPHIYFVQLPKIYKNIKDGKYKGPLSVKSFLDVMTLNQASKDRNQTNVSAGLHYEIDVNKNYALSQGEPIFPLLVKKLQELYTEDYIKEVEATINAEQELDRIVEKNKEQGREEGIQETLEKSVTSAYTAASTLTEQFPIPFDNVFYNSISQTVSNNPDYKSFIIKCAKREYPNWNDAEYEKAVSSKEQKFSSNDESESLPTSTK